MAVCVVSASAEKLTIFNFGFELLEVQDFRSEQVDLGFSDQVCVLQSLEPVGQIFERALKTFNVCDERIRICGSLARHDTGHDNKSDGVFDLSSEACNLQKDLADCQEVLEAPSAKLSTKGRF